MEAGPRCGRTKLEDGTGGATPSTEALARALRRTLPVQGAVIVGGARERGDTCSRASDTGSRVDNIPDRDDVILHRIIGGVGGISGSDDTFKESTRATGAVVSANAEDNATLDVERVGAMGDDETGPRRERGGVVVRTVLFYISTCVGQDRDGKTDIETQRDRGSDKQTQRPGR